MPGLLLQKYLHPVMATAEKRLDKGVTLAITCEEGGKRGRIGRDGEVRGARRRSRE